MDRSERVGSAYFYIEREVLKVPLHAMHSHSSYELYYLVKGEREYFIEDRFFKITAGDIVLIPGKLLHRTAGEGGLRYLVHFSRGFVEKDMEFIVNLIDQVLANAAANLDLIAGKTEEGREAYEEVLANVRKQVRMKTTGMPLNKW